jgi:hypothetical protein
MMVHYFASPSAKDHFRAFLIADLTPAQLDALQEAFGRGACSLSPEPTHQLYIEQKKDWASSMITVPSMEGYGISIDLLNNTKSIVGMWRI